MQLVLSLPLVPPSRHSIHRTHGRCCSWPVSTVSIFDTQPRTPATPAPFLPLVCQLFAFARRRRPEFVSALSPHLLFGLAASNERIVVAYENGLGFDVSTSLLMSHSGALSHLSNHRSLPKSPATAVLPRPRLCLAPNMTRLQRCTPRVHLIRTSGTCLPPLRLCARPATYCLLHLI
jgi:hypothetical protein